MHQKFVISRNCAKNRLKIMEYAIVDKITCSSPAGQAECSSVVPVSLKKVSLTIAGWLRLIMLILLLYLRSCLIIFLACL